MPTYNAKCPLCGQPFECEDDYAGQVAECPHCGREITIPPPSAVQPVLAPRPLQAPPSPPQAQQTLIQNNILVAVPKRSSGLGIAALVLGIIACVFCWMPIVGLLCVPGALLGLVLGVVGLIKALVSKKTSVGMPVAGVVVCVVALIVVSIVSAATVAVGEAMSQAMTETTLPTPQTASEAPALKTTPASAQKSAPAAAPVETWTPASRSMKVGDITVSIVSVEVGKVPLLDMFGDEGRSAEALLMITVSIRNNSETKKIEYQTWNGRSFEFGNDFAVLRDENENLYKRISFGSSKMKGAVKDVASLYPGDTATDILAYEAPVGAAKKLLLALPAKSVGGSGTIRYEIPASMIMKE